MRFSRDESSAEVIASILEVQVDQVVAGIRAALEDDDLAAVEAFARDLRIAADGIAEHAA